jgi:hypothetical protein
MLSRASVFLVRNEERMTDTAEIISRLRSQHIEVACRAADIIERLAASEAEARKSLDEVLERYTALLTKPRVPEIGGTSLHKVRAG